MEPNELMKSISTAVERKRSELCNLKISGKERNDPELVAQLLYNYYAHSYSYMKLSRDFNLNRISIRNIVRRYADYNNQWRKLGGDLAADRVLNLHDIQTTAQDRYADYLEKNKEVIPTPRDIKELSIALANSERAASVARGDATSVTEERRITDKDYEDTLSAAKKRIEEAKKAQVIDVE